MIQITPHMKILVAIEPVDFRRGIDGLAGVCRQVLQSDPLAGTVFVFCSRRRQSIKLLTYDGQGFWIAQKRLSQGRFTHWPKPGEDPACVFDSHQLHALIWNQEQAHATPLWRPLLKAG